MRHASAILWGLFIAGLILWGDIVTREGRGITATCALFLPLLTGIHVLFTLWRHTHLNRPAPDAPTYVTLGPANVLTTTRGLLLAFMTGLLCFGRPSVELRWLPGLLYATAIAADFADGLLARLTHHVSMLGEYLDMHLDSLGVLIASLLAVRLGQMPWWYALAGLARYLHLLGEAFLRRRGRSLAPLPPSPTRRALAGIQMSFLAAVLLPIFTPPATTVVGTALFIPFILGFVRDFLAVAGCHWAAHARWLNVAFWRRFALPLVRWITGGLLIVLSFWNTVQRSSPPGWQLWSAIGLLLVAGILPRLSAAALLALLGLQMTADSPDCLSVLLTIGGTTILIWGGGRLNLWSPDETLFTHHLGGA